MMSSTMESIEGSNIESTKEAGRSKITCDHVNYNIVNINEDKEEKDENYLESFPPGYRFKPLDEELIVWYLIKKIYNQQLPPNRIKDVQLYNFNPQALADKYTPIGDDEWYFFTPRDRKYPNGDRPKRAAGNGYWKATGADKPIMFRGNKVGLKKSLVFYIGKPPSGNKTDWIMHEYKVLDLPKRRKTSPDDMKLDDWVLCKIKKKIKPEKLAKSASRGKSNDFPQNVSDIPIIMGGNEDSGDSGFVYSCHDGISELLDHDHMMRIAEYSNTIPLSFEHLIHEPVDMLGLKYLDVVRYFHSMDDVKDTKN